MGIGSGLGAQIGIVAESSYGTYAAPTKFVEFTKEGLVFRKVTAQSAGIAAGRLVDLSTRRVMTTADAGGPLEMEVTNKAMGLFLQCLMGTTVTPVQQAATIAYLQTHILVDSFGKSLTIQKGVPLTTGTVTDKTFVGCKIISAEFSCEVGGMLTVSFEIDAKDCDETQTLAVASYPAMSPFHFGQMTLKLGTLASETSQDGIRKVSIKIERPMATDRYYAGAAGRKKEPIANDKVKITGSLEMDYVDTVVDDWHTADTGKSLIWEFIGPNIASTYFETFRVSLPVIKFDDAPPVVEGPDVIKPTFNFTGLYDGTNANKIEYMSTDVTL
ncbi:phage tail tube protein [Streptomyces sp. NBC_01262]|uniref:phage tail tube protein n=1 Tax=Streptomyces sp. NBC_01262 TaxID=2903803 RepID=UPI002E32D0FA|nr:phage tail tube protein [Streptomyces sp. NBC_01262]